MKTRTHTRTQSLAADAAAPSPVEKVAMPTHAPVPVKTAEEIPAETAEEIPAETVENIPAEIAENISAETAGNVAIAPQIAVPPLQMRWRGNAFEQENFYEHFVDKNRNAPQEETIQSSPFPPSPPPPPSTSPPGTSGRDCACPCRSLSVRGGGHRGWGRACFSRPWACSAIRSACKYCCD